MPNPENLKGHEFTSDQSRELAAINGRKGGKASGESKRRKKLMREAFEDLLSRDYHDASGKALDGTELLTLKVFKQAMDGDLKAFEIIRDTTGQKPIERIETVEIPPETYARVEAILSED